MIITDRLSLNIKLITATYALTEEDCIIKNNNGAVNVTNTLPPIANLIDGHTVFIGRGQTSTGTITIALGAGATRVQALAGTVGATTSIGTHNATGAGLGAMFTKIGTIWYRF
jgi:hypothetical protein